MNQLESIVESLGKRVDALSVAIARLQDEEATNRQLAMVDVVWVPWCVGPEGKTVGPVTSGEPIPGITSYLWCRTREACVEACQTYKTRYGMRCVPVRIR